MPVARSLAAITRIATEVVKNCSGTVFDSIVPIPPHAEVPYAEAGPFACSKDARRDPRETKLGGAAPSNDDGACCSPGGKCC